MANYISRDDLCNLLGRIATDREWEIESGPPSVLQEKLRKIWHRTNRLKVEKIARNKCKCKK